MVREDCACPMCTASKRTHRTCETFSAERRKRTRSGSADGACEAYLREHTHMRLAAAEREPWQLRVYLHQHEIPPTLNRTGAILTWAW